MRPGVFSKNRTIVVSQAPKLRKFTITKAERNMKLKTLGRLIATFTLLLAGTLLAQETTGGLIGAVKDPSGAVVPGAKVVVTAPSLVGSKQFITDAAGNYRFSNLPPDTYTVTVTAKGFAVVKREGVTIEVGHLPTLDIPMQVGGADTVVEVSGQAPLIDTTTNTTQTNITEDVVNNVPHGRSFQSVIQFAPSARNEPLEGSTTTNGTGGNSPGSTTNGSDHGFSVGGASDAENSYLVEGQETANLIGGYSHTNVPFDFIQEVQVKSSGIEAEHGGALGGVVNVVMKKGTNQYHGSVFMQFENDAMDGSPNAYSRYDPNSILTCPQSFCGTARAPIQPMVILMRLRSNTSRSEIRRATCSPASLWVVRSGRTKFSASSPSTRNGTTKSGRSSSRPALALPAYLWPVARFCSAATSRPTTRQPAWTQPSPRGSAYSPRGFTSTSANRV